MSESATIEDKTSLAQAVLEQLDQIYDAEHLKTDNFFREMTEQDPEGWVSLKKMAFIKRFKTIIGGDLILFEQAAALSPENFEINEKKTHIRCIKKPQEEVIKEQETGIQKKINDVMERQNTRSIYCKGFSTTETPSMADLKEFFGKYGRVVNVRMRRDGPNKDSPFKGSVFVEYETPEIAKTAEEEIKEYNGEPLETMNKQAYVDMKAKTKYADATWEPTRLTIEYFIEYAGATDMSFTDIKTAIAEITPVGRLEELSEKGTGIIQLLEIPPEEFMSKLEDNKLGNLTFRLASAEAKGEFNRLRREKKDQRNKGGRGRGGRGGRGRGGRGRDGRGGRGGRGDHGRGDDSRKRGNDNANNVEISNKRTRSVVEVKTAST
ncbi:hypothetical protein BDB01DRAFT_778353 [Pilobolus umbonatus]|nr:hypothetical protein BDB01DRAFT_778353 [Pilobolus umbonatus]